VESGALFETSSPDFAALHPGYDTDSLMSQVIVNGYDASIEKELI
jgi:hypothetical protein